MHQRGCPWYIAEVESIFRFKGVCLVEEFLEILGEGFGLCEVGHCASVDYGREGRQGRQLRMSHYTWICIIH